MEINIKRTTHVADTYCISLSIDKDKPDLEIAYVIGEREFYYVNTSANLIKRVNYYTINMEELLKKIYQFLSEKDNLKTVYLILDIRKDHLESSEGPQKKELNSLFNSPYSELISRTNYISTNTSQMVSLIIKLKDDNH